MFRLKVRKSRRIRGEADDFGPSDEAFFQRATFLPTYAPIANVRPVCDGRGQGRPTIPTTRPKYSSNANAMSGPFQYLSEDLVKQIVWSTGILSVNFKNH